MRGWLNGYDPNAWDMFLCIGVAALFCIGLYLLMRKL